MEVRADLCPCARPAEGVALLTLSRPERKNALSIALRDAVTAHLASLATDTSTRVVILTGMGSAFSAGFDFQEFQLAASDRALHERLWASSDAFHKALLEFPLPLIAAVNGAALGGGMDTAVLCDIRVASQDARFGHPEAAFGDVVYAPLHELVGGAIARELCLTGRIVDAAEALKIGLASEIVEPGRLLDRAQELALSIARTPRPILLRTKAKIVARARIPFTTTLEL